MIDFEKTILSQWQQPGPIRYLINGLNECIDPTVDFDLFFSAIWNIDTATGYGLDVWGRIVGVGRVLQIATQKYFGFSEATIESADPFNQSPFYSAGGALTENYTLDDDGFRTLILAKALSNITDGSIKSINQILLNLFPGRGNCYVTDGLNMTMNYVFQFALTPVEEAIIVQSGVLPKPAGVKIGSRTVVGGVPTLSISPGVISSVGVPGVASFTAVISQV